MVAVIVKLLMLIALVLMPFGMGSASAMPAGQARMAATGGHCDEQGSQPHEQSSDQQIDCAMACSMLATTQGNLAEPAPSLRLPTARPLAERGRGLHPDTATPPPKPS